MRLIDLATALAFKVMDQALVLSCSDQAGRMRPQGIGSLLFAVSVEVVKWFLNYPNFNPAYNMNSAIGNAAKYGHSNLALPSSKLNLAKPSLIMMSF